MGIRLLQGPHGLLSLWSNMYSLLSFRLFQGPGGSFSSGVVKYVLYTFIGLWLLGSHDGSFPFCPVCIDIKIQINGRLTVVFVGDRSISDRHVN